MEKNVENTAMLADLRREIDLIDLELLRLLQARAACSRAVSEAKMGNVSYRPEREKAIVENLCRLNEQIVEIPFTSNTDRAFATKISQEHIQGIWSEIFSCSRSLQKPFSVAVLGPLGTFSHFASTELFGQSTLCMPCADFSEVFEKVYEKDVFFGLVPFENSQQGSVGQCLDLFDTYPVKIVAEHYSSICQCLLSIETDISQVYEVFSHPQALMQSGDWLRKNLPNAKLTEMTSTAHAAKRAFKEAHTAVIGHEKLSQFIDMEHLEQQQKRPPINNNESRLHLLAKDIARDKNNTTRFVLIAPQNPDSLAGDFAGSFDTKSIEVFKNPKTTFTFSLPDKTGALSQILTLFDKFSINLSKMESRPLYQRLKQDTWQYRFFADANGNLGQEKELLSLLREICYDFRILGVYENNLL